VRASLHPVAFIARVPERFLTMCARAIRCPWCFCSPVRTRHGVWLHERQGAGVTHGNIPIRARARATQGEGAREACRNLSPRMSITRVIGLRTASAFQADAPSGTPEPRHAPRSTAAPGASAAPSSVPDEEVACGGAGAVTGVTAAAGAARE
jgi:hypothetical protein